MILFHYTSAQHLAKIRTQGIHRGVIPWKFLDGKATFVRGWQWLTINPDWEQSWCDPKYSQLPYRRDEFRITIAVPKFAYPQVLRWLDFCAKHAPESATELNARPHDPQNWRLFHGPIPATWFVDVQQNPTRLDLTHLEQ